MLPLLISLKSKIVGFFRLQEERKRNTDLKVEKEKQEYGGLRNISMPKLNY